MANEVGVVGDVEDTTMIREERVFELFDRREVEVVGGLIKDEEIGITD